MRTGALESNFDLAGFSLVLGKLLDFFEPQVLMNKMGIIIGSTSWRYRENYRS